MGRLSAAIGKRIAWVIALAGAAAAGSQSTATQAPAGPDLLTARIAADGSVPVVIGVRTPFVPEGNLGSPDVVRQRLAILTAVDAVMGEAQAAGALLGERFETIPFFNARVDAGALASLRAMSDVGSIEEDALLRPTLGQSVPLINATLSQIGHSASGWSVAIIDTGVERLHPFFMPLGFPKTVQEACYSNANGLGTGTSNCPGGATSSTELLSGANCSATISGCDHGTHVAGIAAGWINGQGGSTGVATGASIWAIQVATTFTDPAACGAGPSPCAVAYTSDVVRALEHAFLLTGSASPTDRLASVNLSLAGGSPSTDCDAGNPSIKAAIDNLRSRGIATVIASGNDGYATGISAPACVTTAVSVGSTTKTPEVVSSFTNRGAGLPALMAPGSNIMSSIPGGGHQFTFGAKSGTSMAAPHVTGAWALLKSAVPSATVAQVLNALRTTAVTVEGYPRINVSAARLALMDGNRPGAPAPPTITGAGNSVTISWTAPGTGEAPTGYTVVARLAAGGPIVATLPVGNTLTTTVSAPDGTYHVSVRASNASGNGPESAGVTFRVPLAGPVPGAPAGLTVAVTTDQAIFSWTPPATGGTAAGYLLVASGSPGGGPLASLPLSAPRSTVTIGAIPPGTYYVRLAATNSAGSSPFSNEVVVAVASLQVPGAPTLNAAAVAGRSVSLSWSPGSGGAASSFLIVASTTPGGTPIASLPVSGTSITVSAPSGRYFVRVQGVNRIGTGAASNEVTVDVP